MRRARYTKPMSCQSCDEMNPNKSDSECYQCLADRTQEVTVLGTGIGFFGTMAFVRFADGREELVFLSALTMLDDEEKKSDET